MENKRKDMESWSVEDVAFHFLELGATDEILEKIEKEQIDGDALSVMTEEDLKEIVPIIGVRLRHRKWVEKAKRSPQQFSVR